MSRHYSEARAASARTSSRRSKTAEHEVRFVDIADINNAAPSGWESTGGFGGGGGGGFGDYAEDGDAEALAQAVGATLHVRDHEPPEARDELSEEEIDDDNIVDKFLG